MFTRLANSRWQAFSFLYDRYSKASFSIILQVVPQKEFAEDVLQDAL